MSMKSILKGSNMATIAEMVFSLLTLPMALSYITGEVEAAAEAREQCTLLSTFFINLALARLFRARRFRLAGKPVLKARMQLVYAGAFLVCGLLPMFIGYTKSVGIQTEQTLTGGYMGDVRQLTALIFWGVLVIGRIVSIICNHRWRNIVLNVLLLVLSAAYCIIAYMGCDMIVASTLASIIALGSIFAVVFGRIRMDVLKTIIRKTYASEIILGLLLLIFAFAYVFKFLESGIETFEDGLWYGFAIVTTIGFGDITATSLIGRILSVVLGIYGIVVVAMITSIIVNFYGESKKEPDNPDEFDEPVQSDREKNKEEGIHQ